MEIISKKHFLEKIISTSFVQENEGSGNNFRYQANNSSKAVNFFFKIVAFQSAEMNSHFVGETLSQNKDVMFPSDVMFHQHIWKQIFEW